MKNKLIELKTLLQDNGTKLRLAEDKHGVYVLPQDPTACRFCALGGIAVVWGVTQDPSANSEETYNKVNALDVTKKLADKILKQDYYKSEFSDPDDDDEPWSIVSSNWDAREHVVMAALEELIDEQN